MQLLTPVIFLVDKMSNAILRLLRIDPNKKITTMTEAELRTYVDVGHEDGVIENEGGTFAALLLESAHSHAVHGRQGCFRRREKA